MPSSLEHDIVCFSHLRWDFVYQRPQHLLSRFAVHSRVFFVEEARSEDVPSPRYLLQRRRDQLWTVTPLLPLDCVQNSRRAAALRALLDQLFNEMTIGRFVAWYYTPMALEFSQHLRPSLTIYDCMDELSMFAGAPKHLSGLEADLLKRADLVFTGGQSLYEAKQKLHHSVHLFPSAVDATHFRRAENPGSEPEDQAQIARPRLGFYGVIDERMDLPLVREVADARGDWQIVMVGPVVKIDASTLPQSENIHYLGRKEYEVLPSYLAGWDVAIMPFARNESTRFISPTKTLEYLAGRKPVISTGVRDVVEPYGRLGMISIANDCAGFVSAAERILAKPATPSLTSDAIVNSLSWDRTWKQMHDNIAEQLLERAAVSH